MFQKNFAESLAKEGVVKMFDRSPGKEISSCTFGNKGMNVRIPLEIATKSVEDTDEAGGKMFPFIHFEKHTENNIPNRMKKHI